MEAKKNNNPGAEYLVVIRASIFIPMTTLPRLLVYKASAGSGKTFTLALQYIKHLIDDPFAYRRILAVTFTNKATAEMKARILEQLYGLSHRLESSNGYMAQLTTLTGKSENEIEEVTGKALRNILHDYSRFRIETIDSFFQSVMRNLARELGIGTNMNIELNPAEALSDAVDSMIEKLRKDSPVISVLLDYIQENISENKKWDVSKELKKFSNNLFKEEYIKRGSQLRQKLSDPQFIPSFKRQVKALREEILDQMAGFSDQFYGLLEENGLTTDDLISKSKGISSYFNKLKDPLKIVDEKTRNSTLLKHMESADNWVSKTHKRKEVIKEIASRELMPLLQTAEEFRQKNARLLNSCNLSVKCLNNLQLLSNVSEEMHTQNVLYNRLLLSETNALLHGLISEGDASFIYEKIGTAIDIVMIDEFQDTSQMQWENFHLLLEESLSQKEGSLIVGDIKQSIYRWRGGDWKILGNINHDRTLRPEERTLDTNWRSEARIVKFNNEIFASACRVLANRYEQEEKLGSSEPLTHAYQDIRQLTSKKEEKGYVKLTFIPKEKGFPYQDTVLADLANEISNLTQKGIHTNDIAILIRENKSIPIIADYFERKTSFRIVSDEAFRLDASLAISMMIDALRYLASPENNIAKARLAVSFQREILHKDIRLNDILLGVTDDYLPAEFLLRTDELRFMPLYELLETLFGIFDMKQISKQDAYLCAFYDNITDYIQNNSSDLTAFITHWDDTLHKKTIPSGEIDGIRILSIHKSKGLEYSTVLIPFCDWNINKGDLMWCSVSNQEKADIAPFNQLDITPIRYHKAMKESVYKECYADETLQLWVDNLNILYVAFTRACHNLIVWGKDETKDSASKLLTEALENMANFPMKQTVTEDRKTVYEYGEVSVPKLKGKTTSDNPLHATPEAAPIHIESVQTDIEFRQSNRSAQFIKGDSDTDKPDYIQQGELLHQVFASIGKASDVTQAVERLCFEGVIASTKQKEQILKLSEWALNNPRVKAWYDGSWQLYNECSIIYTDTEGVMQTRRPDRVMTKDGHVVVVDFKFGKKHDEYNDQVREYMQLLSQMGYTDITGCLWYVFANELMEVNL